MALRGLNNSWHYEQCPELGKEPSCDCVKELVIELSVMTEECKRLMEINRTLSKQLNNGR